MTIPVTPNTNATRYDAAIQFRNLITQPIIDLPKWHGLNFPITGISMPDGATKTTVGHMVDIMTVGAAPTNAPLPAPWPNIPADQLLFGPAASVSALSSLFRTTAIVLSRVRLLRARAYYSNTNTGTNDAYFDVTAHAHLRPQYQLGSTWAVDPSGTMSAFAFTTFVNQLNTAVTNHRNSVVNYTEQWCHSSCHTNYANRSRR